MIVVVPVVAAGAGVQGGIATTAGAAKLVLAGAGINGVIGFWTCDQADNSVLAPSLDQDTSCLATEIALGAVLSPLAAVGGGQLVPRVAVVCVGGAVDGAASATAHMVLVEEDQAFDAANALVAGGIGCATAGVLDSAFNRFFRSADDVRPARLIECNSFPSGTPVLMADGSHKAIDQIDPGDQVLAYDEETGEWNARSVLDQWSHVDTGEMVTVTLADGSSVSATDHHLFWVASDQQWVEAENLETGDVLVDPDGPVEVAGVSYWPDGPNIVWELAVGIDHTFTVHTGTADVVVHNADVCDWGPNFPKPSSGAHIRNNLGAPIVSLQTRVNSALSDALQRPGGESVSVQIHHVLPQWVFRLDDEIPYEQIRVATEELRQKIDNAGFDVHDFRNTVALPTRTNFTGEARDRLDELALFDLDAWPASARHNGGHSPAYYQEVIVFLNETLPDNPTSQQVGVALTAFVERILRGQSTLYSS